MADKKTIVTAGGGGSILGPIVAVVALLALIVVLFLLFGRELLDGGTEKIDADIRIETPAK